MKAPIFGMKYLPATSAMPSSSAASSGPVIDEVPPTDDHDQEIDHELEREGRVQPEDLGAQRAAQPGQARADREGQQEHAR